MKDKALQHGKGAVSRFEERFKVVPRDVTGSAGKGDPAHAIVMSKYGLHAPEGTAGEFSVLWRELVVQNNWNMARQDRLEMSRFYGSNGKAQIQTGGRREYNSAPLSAHMCEVEPHIFSAPLMIVGFDATSIGIEYF